MNFQWYNFRFLWLCSQMVYMGHGGGGEGQEDDERPEVQTPTVLLQASKTGWLESSNLG